MEIRSGKSGEGAVVITLAGRLDTVTAPALEGELEKLGEGVKEVVFEMGELEYISSAGLRTLLTTHKRLHGRGGGIHLKGVGGAVMEVLELTGLSGVFSIG